MGTPLGKTSMAGFQNKFDYTGGEIRQEVTFTDKNGTTSKVLTEGTDYTVSYQNHINAGKATVVYTGINGYTGTVRKSYTIQPV